MAGDGSCRLSPGFRAVGLGVIFGLIWPPIQHGINSFGVLLMESGSFGAFVFGVFNRLLIVTGLHHILNNMAWFVFGSFTDPTTGAVVTGDLTRYFAGDPKGGQFMTGMFPVMLFGLPAACLAMYRNALPERRKVMGGIFLSMALTSFLTGVTEPIEFAFMFLAPFLYLLHALLTGLSMAVTNMLNIHLGFTFSGGFIDMVLGWGKSTNGWLVVPVGLAYAVIYYSVFSYCIRRFNLKTPGREDIQVAQAEVDDRQPARHGLHPGPGRRRQPAERRRLHHASAPGHGGSQQGGGCRIESTGRHGRGSAGQRRQFAGGGRADGGQHCR